MFIWNISLSKKNWSRCDQKCTYIFMYRTRHSYQTLMKTWVFSTNIGKILKYQVLWKSIQRELSCCLRWDGRTDGQTDMTKLIVDFRKCTNASKRFVFIFHLILRIRLIVQSCHLFPDLFWFFRLHFLRLLHVLIIDLLFMFRITVNWKWCWSFV